MTENQTAKTAIVFGGTGFLGRYIVPKLAAAGYQVRVPTRNPSSAGHLTTAELADKVTLVDAEISDAGAVKALVEGAQLVVNLVGILAETSRQKFPAIHTELPTRIAEAAAASGVAQLIHISAIGADADSKAGYARSKALGEAALLAAFPKAIILRPSVVFGPEDGFLNLFGDMSKFAPALPLIGGGKTVFQPVYVGDVAEAVMATINGKAGEGATYELGGPGRFSFKQVLQYILEVTGRKRLLMPLPFAIARIQGAVLERLPGQLLTQDQVEMLKSDNVVADGAKTLADLGVEATKLEDIAPSYLTN